MPAKKEEEPQEELCGHINKHNWTYKEELGHSVLEDLACTLPAGHDGDHSARKFEISFRNDGRASEGEKAVFWNDSAGTPADQIEPDIASLLEMKERERKEQLLRLHQPQ